MGGDRGGDRDPRGNGDPRRPLPAMERGGGARGGPPPPCSPPEKTPPLPGEGPLRVKTGRGAGGAPQPGDTQLIFFLGPGFLRAPRGAQSAKSPIVPLPTPPPPPAGVDIRGNV